MVTAINYRACLTHKNCHIIPLGGQSNIKQQCHRSWMLTFGDSEINVTITYKYQNKFDFSNNLNKHKIKFRTILTGIFSKMTTL